MEYAWNILEHIYLSKYIYIQIYMYIHIYIYGLSLPTWYNLQVFNFSILVHCSGTNNATSLPNRQSVNSLPHHRISSGQRIGSFRPQTFSLAGSRCKLSLLEGYGMIRIILCIYIYIYMCGCVCMYVLYMYYNMYIYILCICTLCTCICI